MTSPARVGAAVGAVAVGAAVGAVLRQLVSAAVPVEDGVFPWTTFAINVVGSFLLALLPAVGFVRRRPLLPPLLGTGVLGGFTTLSAWSVEARALYATDHVETAGAYVLGTLVACLLAVHLGDLLSTVAARAAFEDEEGDL